MTIGSAAVFAAALAGAATAAEILPSSYVTSGVSGFYPDSTGLELTDGVIADRHFTEYAPAGAPYVGWRSVDPQVTFSFAAPQTFGKAVVWVDDFGGQFGVTAPTGLSFTLAGQTFTNFTVGAPLDAGFVYASGWAAGGGTPYIVDLGGLQASSINLAIARGGEWTFVSEVEFFTERALTGAVPEPGVWALMILGFGLTGGAVRRRRMSLA